MKKNKILPGIMITCVLVIFMTLISNECVGGEVNTLIPFSDAWMTEYADDLTDFIVDQRQKSTGEFSVIDFGAKGDGKHDDTLAIKATIAAAYNIDNPGVVRIPRGYYRLTDTIKLIGGVNLIGDGVSSILGMVEDKELLSVSGNFENMYIEKISLYTAAISPGIPTLRMSARANRSVIRDVSFIGGPIGVKLEGTIGLLFENNTFSAGKGYAKTWRQFGVKAKRGKYAIFVTKLGNTHSNCVAFRDIRVENTHEYGFWFDSQGEGNFLLDNCIVEGNDYVKGIYVSRSNHFSMRNLHLEGKNTNLVLENCKDGVISASRSSFMTFKNCTNLNLISNFCEYFDISGGMNVNISGLDCRSYKNTSSLSDVRGLYSSWSGGTIIPAAQSIGTPENMCEGNLEVWSKGLPVGFTQYGIRYSGGQAAISRNTEYVKYGNSSAKIEVKLNSIKNRNCGLVFELPIEDFKSNDERKKFVTISAWFYVPSNGGRFPWFSLYKKYQWGGYVGWTVSGPKDEWFKVSRTLVVPCDAKEVSIRTVLWAAPPGSECYTDGWEITEGAIPSIQVTEVLSRADFRTSGILMLPKHSTRALPDPTTVPAGAIIFNTDDDTVYVSDGMFWKTICYEVGRW